MTFRKAPNWFIDYRLLKLPVIMIFTLFLFSGSSIALAASNTVKQHIIIISGFEFSPKVIKVNNGDIITWHNQDIAPHNIAKLSDQSVLSVDLLKGETFSLQIDSELSYLCGLHPSMQGKIFLN